MEADKKEITALVETYRDGFATLNAEKLISIWDRDYGEIIYCPIEAVRAVRGWLGIEHYYRDVTKRFRRVHSMEIPELSVHLLGDVAYAFFTFRFEAEVRDRSEPFKVEGRNTLIFRRTKGAWKGIHYHESRTGPY
jgi:ketosteroid isomerase-like protein